MKIEQQQRLYDALHLIAHAFKSPEKLRRTCEKEYGLEYDEALEYAYENMQAEAKAALKGVRRPKETT